MQMEYSEKNMLSIPGATIQNGEYEEFHADPEGLKDIIMNVFYESSDF